MRSRFSRVLLLAALVVSLGVSAVAQEGHPLTGTWYGEYGTGAGRADVTIVMKWDGAKVTGLVNPGPGATPITDVVLDVIPGKAGTRSLNNPEGTEPVPPIFNVRFQAGDLRVDGRIINPVGGNRSLVGTYTKGADKGAFRMKRL